jgi:hypothetical protein
MESDSCNGSILKEAMYKISLVHDQTTVDVID